MRDKSGSCKHVDGILKATEVHEIAKGRMDRKEVQGQNPGALYHKEWGRSNGVGKGDLRSNCYFFLPPHT